MQKQKILLNNKLVWPAEPYVPNPMMLPAFVGREKEMELIMASWIAGRVYRHYRWHWLESKLFSLKLSCKPIGKPQIKKGYTFDVTLSLLVRNGRASNPRPRA